MRRFSDEAVEYSIDKVAPRIISVASADPLFARGIEQLSVGSLLQLVSLCRDYGILDSSSSEEDLVAALSLALSQVIDDFAGVLHEELSCVGELSAVEAC